MYTLMIYSLKVGACLAVFYLFFKLLLSRETFHRLNRIVVLAAMVLSFVLPLCVITVYRELPAMPELPVTEDAGYAPSAEPESQPFPWDKAVTAAFLAGAAAALLWTLGSVCGSCAVSCAPSMNTRPTRRCWTAASMPDNTSYY